MSHDISYMIIWSGSETASWGHELTILVSASHLLVTINCSSNFAIYCAKVTENNKIDLFIKTFLRLPKKHMFYFLDFKTRRKIIGCRTANSLYEHFLSQDKKFRKYFFKYLMLKELKPNHRNPVVALVTRKKLTQESQLGLDEDGEQFVWVKPW